MKNEKRGRDTGMDGLNPNVLHDKLEVLRTLMPEVFVEGKLDAELLGRLLRERNVDGSPVAPVTEETEERFALTWPGKEMMFDEIAKQSHCTLTLDSTKSSDAWEESDNVFIEGENLEVLRSLQKAYFGKVKMIYIDPPYNTGKDFVYHDDFKQTEDEYCDECNVSENGHLAKAHKLNTRDSGRFHSNWLSMMYPRLFLAKNLLRDDGVIFVSIDDNEVHNLRAIINEIFGEENFVAEFVWKKKGTSTNVSGVKVSALTEYVLCFSKSINGTINPRITRPEDRVYPFQDKEGFYRKAIIEKKDTGNYKRDSMKFEILGITPREGKRWQIGKIKALELESKDRFLVEDGTIKLKIYKHEDGISTSAQPNLLMDIGSTQTGQSEVDSIFLGSYFDTPKPSTLLQHFVKLGSSENDTDIILDFFAGSGTTAHAVMAQNVADGGKRQYICVQMPEETPEGSEARKAGFARISDIALERIKRAAAKIKTENPEATADFGVRYYKATDSHFPVWRARTFKDDAALSQALIDYVNKPSLGTARQRADEVLLKLGYPLTTKLTDHGGWYMAEGNVALALDDAFAVDNLMDIFAHKPITVVVAEAIFKKDEDKINFDLRCTEHQVIFQTV